MTRPEWRVQGTKPLMYSHINNHNTGIHTQLLDDKSYKITICQVWYDMLTVRRRRLNVVNLEPITTYSGSLFHTATCITRTGKEFARTLIRESG